MGIGASVSEPDLLKVAQRITSTKGWLGPVLHQAIYEWTSPTHLIYYRREAEQERIYLLDTSFKKSVWLEGLTKFSSKEGIGLGLTPSPDGALLVGQGGTKAPLFFVVDLEGREIGRWPVRRPGGFHDRFDGTKFTYTFWTSDSRGLIETAYDHNKMGDKLTSWLRRLEALNNPLGLGATIVNNRWSWGGWPDFADYHRSFQIGLDPSKDEHETAQIVAWATDRYIAETQYRVSFPGNDISDWEPSPDGKTILWKTTTAPAGPGSWVYEPLNSKKRPKGPHYIRMWVTNWDGSGKRLLGRLELKKGDEYWDWHSCGHLRFVPGDRSVSFVFRHSLYVVSL